MVNQYHIEVWAWIPNCEGEYEISTLGEVRSHKRGVPHMLVQMVHQGYCQVVINGKTKKVHQLSAMAFLGHTPNGYEIIVDHKDNVKKNNALYNLQLISQRENSTKDTNKITGSRFHKGSGKWGSSIVINGKNIYLGFFDSPEEASVAYMEALEKHNNGEPVVRTYFKKKRLAIRRYVYRTSDVNKWRVIVQYKKVKYYSKLFSSEQEACDYSLIFKEMVYNGEVVKTKNRIKILREGNN